MQLAAHAQVASLREEVTAVISSAGGYPRSQTKAALRLARGGGAFLISITHFSNDALEV